MPTRLPIPKTYKLFIGGAFPRSESGRSEPITSPSGELLGHSCRASRKDLRDAVTAARKAHASWSAATPYLRSQILYRMAEMLEGKAAEFHTLLGAAGATAADAQRELALSVDRLVAFAGWADKFAAILGRQNPVSAPYWNISIPQPVGAVGVVCPPSPALLPLVSLVAPVICSGNAAVVITPASPAVASVFGEVCATSDLPGGVVNILTGRTDELVPVLASHRDVDAVHAAAGDLAPELARALRSGAADNLKRVTIRPQVEWADAEACHSPEWIEPFVEIKTVWHPVGT